MKHVDSLMNNRLFNFNIALNAKLFFICLSL